MGYFLNLIYLLLVFVFSPYWIYQAWRHGKYRDGFLAKFFGQVPVRTGTNPAVWFHAVSVGEVVLIAPLITRFRQKHPEYTLVVSTTSRTGHEVALKKYPELVVFYAPLDFTWAVHRAIRRVRPTMLVLVELEVWPNLIRQASRSGVRLAIVNGRLSDHSFAGYRRLERWIRPIFSTFDMVLAQDESSASHFLQLGVPESRLIVTGSMKYDGAQTNRFHPATRCLFHLTGWTDLQTIFLAGSTQSGEEEAAIATLTALAPRHPELRLVLVPRHPERFEEVWQLCEKSGISSVRRSQLMNGPTTPAPQILLVDTVGELSAWWGVADIAFVGGSFGDRGGQNMIEPAGFGAAVCFGPNTRNFRDIVATLLAADAAQVVQNGTQMRLFVEHCLIHPEYAAALGERARTLVIHQQGAVQTTLETLEKVLTDAK
ncbi:MAG: 3-deoxy-D-manno-octulosonic acid transferase [Thermoguttaceae bacterium]|nr:3-deoxy-D-manno-octulosonic acid transferase [Thermoguttaceae bacterium]